MIRRRNLVFLGLSTRQRRLTIVSRSASGCNTATTQYSSETPFEDGGKIHDNPSPISSPMTTDTPLSDDILHVLDEALNAFKGLTSFENLNNICVEEARTGVNLYVYHFSFLQKI